jgi:hypothetical protein
MRDEPDRPQESLNCWLHVTDAFQWLRCARPLRVAQLSVEMPCPRSTLEVLFLDGRLLPAVPRAVTVRPARACMPHVPIRMAQSLEQGLPVPFRPLFGLDICTYALETLYLPMIASLGVKGRQMDGLPQACNMV